VLPMKESPSRNLSPKGGLFMSYLQKKSLSVGFRDVYAHSEQYLGSMYFNFAAQKWAIKEYPGQWFDEEAAARDWLITRNQPTVKG
jgi:hypothetical protein